MSQEKRKSQWSHYDHVEFKRPAGRLPNHPGREYVEPQIYQQPYLEAEQTKISTHFQSWTEQQIKDFLDHRGGDYYDCKNFQELVARAQETEINTGPAVQPSTAKDDEEEYDPLEAFMREINQEVQEDAPSKNKGMRELDGDVLNDPAADFMEARRAGQLNPMMMAAAVASAQGGGDSDDDVYAMAQAVDANNGVEYDSDDHVVTDGKKKAVEPLPAVDHSSIEYDEFAKDFYEEHKETAARTPAQVNELRRQLDVHVSGFDPPKPITAFEHCGFDQALMAAIKKAGYDKPTAIQAQALSAALSGRDVLGLAKTGSGKTAAFVLPMLVHIMDQPELSKGQGPIAIILAPTRELAEQIHKEARKFSKPYGLQVAAVFGGLSKYEQVKALRAGCEVAVCTPGRLIDVVKMKACTLQRVTYVVLDEADRMFDMGFEYQVRSIMGQIRPDRQTLLFSATMPRKVEHLTGDILTSPVRITVGITGVANQDVRQEVEVLSGDEAKMQWLAVQLQGLIDEGDVIIFVSQKAKVEELTERLTAAGVRGVALHGDMDQHTRMAVLESFRSGEKHVLVATDVAARGLDIKTIKTVLNYDAAKDIDTHIHRVGRTGRAGDKEGRAITLLNANQSWFAGQMVQSLTLAGQEVPRNLHELAMKDASFRKGSKRSKGGRGGGKQRGRPKMGGAGLGFAGKTANPNASISMGGFTWGAEGTGGMSGFQKSATSHTTEGPASSGADPGTQGGTADNPPARAAAAAPSGARMGGFVASSTTSTGGHNTAGGGIAGGGGRADVLTSMYTGRFKSAFVSSGITGGDIGQSATIVAPKTAPARPVPPPPIPVTHQPTFTIQTPLHSRSSFGTGAYNHMQPPPSRNTFPSHNAISSSSSYNAMRPPTSLNAPLSYNAAPSSYDTPPAAAVALDPTQSAAVAQAVAAAQAIAARLTAQKQAGAGGDGSNPWPTSKGLEHKKRGWDT